MKRMEKDFLKGVSADNRVLISKYLDRAESCFYEDTIIFTDFLNPLEAQEFLRVVERIDGLTACSFGGVEEAERVVAGVAKTETNIAQDQFPITPLKLTYNKKTASNKLTHRDFLGSVLALGINRSKIGDILIHSSCAFVFVHESIGDYVLHNLFKIAKDGVQVTVAAWDEIYAVFTDYTEKHITVASLRADALAAAAFSLSREAVQGLVKSDKLLVNWVAVGAHKTVGEGDIVTLRGYGRLKVQEIFGLTKKERVSLSVQIYK